MLFCVIGQSCQDQGQGEAQIRIVAIKFFFSRKHLVRYREKRGLHKCNYNVSNISKQTIRPVSQVLSWHKTLLTPQRKN